MARGQLLTMSSLTGSIGGLSFRDSNGTSVMYGKGSAARKTSNKVTTRRMYIAYYSRQWRAQTEAYRLSWHNAKYADMSGYELYMYCHLNRSVLGLFPLVTIGYIPPTPLFNTFTPLFIANGNKGASTTFTPNPSIDWSIEFQATPPLSVGVRVVKDSLFRNVGTAINAMNGTTSVTTGYNSTFGTAAGNAGKKVFMRARLIHKATGCASIWLYNSTIFT